MPYLPTGFFQLVCLPNDLIVCKRHIYMLASNFFNLKKIQLSVELENLDYIVTLN